MDIPNYGNKELNPKAQNTRPTFMDELEKRERIKKAMEKLKYEIANDMGYNYVNIPYGNDLTSREIGFYAGPVGGYIVKDLIAAGEKALLEKHGKK